MLSRGAAPPSSRATRSVAQKRGAEAPGQQAPLRRLLQRVGQRLFLLLTLAPYGDFSGAVNSIFEQHERRAKVVRSQSLKRDEEKFEKIRPERCMRSSDVLKWIILLAYPTGGIVA